MEGCEGILIPWPLREPRSSRKEAEESAESLSTNPPGKKMKPHKSAMRFFVMP